jgi:hypothetical protein
MQGHARALNPGAVLREARDTCEVPHYVRVLSVEGITTFTRSGALVAADLPVAATFVPLLLPQRSTAVLDGPPQRS